VSKDDYLEFFREQYLDGKRFALIEAILWCERTKTPIPEWAHAALAECYRKVINFEVDSWDDVLGKALPEGMHKAKAKRLKELAPKVVAYVNQRHFKDGRPIDDELFGELRAQFGIGRTLGKELYSHGHENARPGRRKRPPRN
jgi:hypothetical protein